MATTHNGLAYTFWHWRRSSVPAAEYEGRQRGFHAALAAHPPDGFFQSISSSVTGAPWANSGGNAYQDRYILRDSAVLDVLEQAAISGMRQRPHDDAARVAEGGTAGLYQARIGRPITAPRHALWFAKPDGMSYDALFDQFRPLVREGENVLWMRQMVLGPSPEFCVESTNGFTIPPEFRPLSVALRPIWPL
jgi:hypothetical protein